MELTTMSFDHLASLKAAIPMQSYDAELAEFSAVQFEPMIIINRNTWNVLTDHTRHAALATEQKIFHVILVSIDASEEIAAAIAYSGGVNGTLTGKPDTDSLIRYVKSQAKTPAGKTNLIAMGADADYWKEFFIFIANTEAEPETESEQAAPEIPPNDYDIPTLDAKKQPSAEELEGLQWTAYGSQARTKEANAVLFYVDDKRFGKIDLIKSQTRYAIETNYSTDQLMPRATVLNDIWKKRTLAKQWQANGIAVIVDMNVSRAWFDDNLIGVPPEWKVYANKYSHADPSHLFEAYERVCAHSGPDIIYIVYGTTKAADICQQNGWIYINVQEAIGRVGQ